MCPRLFQIGPFTIYGYGLMLALGFIIASYVLTEEFKRRKLDANIASTITLIALFAGIAGCKILYLIENWNDFLLDPAGMTFNPGGLTYFGGFLLAMGCIALYLRKKPAMVITVSRQHFHGEQIMQKEHILLPMPFEIFRKLPKTFREVSCRTIHHATRHLCMNFLFARRCFFCSGKCGRRHRRMENFL